MAPLTTSGSTLRTIALTDLATLQQELLELQRHARHCTACGAADHDSSECVVWLRERWAQVAELVGGLRITTASLARGEELMMADGGER